MSHKAAFNSPLFRAGGILLGATLLFSTAMLLPGCGGTSVGNPVHEPIVIESGPYSNTLVSFNILNWILPKAFAAAAVTDFRFCVTQLKLIGSSEDLLEAKLGLIDLSNPNITSTWGTVNVPVGGSLTELHAELHQDSETCGGANFSVSYNGQTLTRDLEFKFVFSPAIELNKNDLLTLGLSNIAAALEDASMAGQFTNEQITNYLTQETKGTGAEN